MSAKVYKLCSRAEWEAAARARVYRGSPDDARDGFIHFSSEHQVEATARKYFDAEPELLLVAFSADALGPSLRFEPSRGGELFPHLYGPLDPSLALSVVAIPYDGRAHDFSGAFS